MATSPTPVTALYAPAHRVSKKSNSSVFNPPLGPNAAMSLDLAGNGIQDQRLQYGMYKATCGALGWHSTSVQTVNVVPSTLGAATIAAAAHVVSGTAMTLASAAGGITVLAAATSYFPSNNSIPAGALVIDGEPAFYGFGDGFVTGVYDNTTMLGRNLSVTGEAGGAGGAFLVSGYDVYGEPMTETITATAGATSVDGLKAWKFVVSIVPQFTDAHNYSFGTGDVYGFPMLTAVFQEVSISWAGTAITASTGYTVADTATATATTGDVRGTYAVQSASDGSKRLVITQRPSLSSMNTNGIPIGLWGQVQA